MFFRHSSNPSRVIFIFGIVCAAAFTSAMPLQSSVSSVKSQKDEIAVLIPHSDNAAVISKRNTETVTVQAAVSYPHPNHETTSSPTPLSQMAVSAKLQKALDLVSPELEVIVTITTSTGTPHREQGMVKFLIDWLLPNGEKRVYGGKIGVTGSTAKDIGMEKVTTLTLIEVTGDRKGSILKNEQDTYGNPKNVNSELAEESEEFGGNLR
ncbi:hypothetical protein GG344DRAFT_66216 [Lentinula edodes]|nr:hypothetical protein GG344DRAFT_66216 [Lentinula edodes]